MAERTGSSLRWIVLGIVAGVALLFQVAGLTALGVPGGLLMAGVTLFLVGLGAAVTGRARWAFIASRRIGALVAVAGLLALVVGSMTAPPTEPTASTSDAGRTPPSAPAGPTPEDDTAAAEATEPPPSAPATATIDPEPTAPSGPPAQGTALAALASVEVKGRAPRTGYDRNLFGDGWVDTDRNGCDTRNDVLARDLAGETFKAGTRNCVVLTGTLADPYSGRTIAFQRGQDTSAAVQIDHVVALSDAWQKGAQGLDAGRRTAFANDPLNLLAVDGPLNMQKGDGDAATWLPPHRAYRCAYVARQVAVKVTYGLWMTQAEKDAVARVLGACPDEPLPGGVAVSRPASVAPQPPAPAPVPAPAPAPVPAPAPAPVAGAYFANCTDARAAGAAPLRAGDPGYRAALDRDGDGDACE